MKTLYIVMAEIVNVLGDKREISADQVVPFQREFAFDDRIQAVHAAANMATLMGGEPTVCAPDSGEIVCVTALTAYRAEMLENGDIDYANMAPVPSGQFVPTPIINNRRTYAQAYAALAEQLDELIRLLGLEEGRIQIDGITSQEASESYDELLSLRSEIDFTIIGEVGNTKMMTVAHQGYRRHWFPKFDLPSERRDAE